MLIGKMGTDKASYVLVTIPVIVVILSVIFAEFCLEWQFFLGMLLLFGRDMIVLQKS